jgi:hypothetical protein
LSLGRFGLSVGESWPQRGHVDQISPVAGRSRPWNHVGIKPNLTRPFKLSTLRGQWVIFWPEWVGVTVLKEVVHEKDQLVLRLDYYVTT